MPEAGMSAPDFSGLTDDSTLTSLADYKGKKLALYFYPRDNTPGCTRQACNLRENYEALSQKGIAIIGISDDPVEKHAVFIKRLDLPFPLIADTERVMLNAYGVYGEKKLYGRTYVGTKRTTFLIDEDGIIVKVLKKPKVGDHAVEILMGFGLTP